MSIRKEYAGAYALCAIKKIKKYKLLKAGLIIYK
jgi:hypothetical protein